MYPHVDHLFITITRCSVEHSTPHANGAQLHFTGLSYRIWNDKVVPITWQSMEEVAFHFNLQ